MAQELAPGGVSVAQKLPRRRTSRGTFAGLASLPEVAESFWSKVDVRGPEECWPWTASRTGGDGRYGQFSAAGWPGLRGAHRWAFFLAHGHRPVNGEVGHACHNGLCCNPAHLQDVTRQENEAAKDEAGRRPRGVTDAPCQVCGGPREGRAVRGTGAVFAYCRPCKAAYLSDYRRRRTVRRAPTKELPGGNTLW